MLDQAKVYAAYDPDDIAYGIDHLAEQVRLAWSESRLVKFPASYKTCSNIVIAGMGGSALGPDMLQSVFFNNLTVPVTIVRGYDLPAFVDNKTLVLLSSFSGTTEEVLEAAVVAKKRKAKIMAIAAATVGHDRRGEVGLQELAAKEGWPMYVFTPGDLAKQPRLGTGFSLAGILGMMSTLEYVKFGEADVRRLLTAMGDVLDTCAVDVLVKDNPAKTVAQSLHGRTVFVIGAEHLLGNAHVLSNQINETSKQFATYFALPELNHHLLEGLTFPKGFIKNVTVLMLRSAHYHERVQKRFKVTADIFERIGIEVIEYDCGGKDAIEECGEVLQYGSFLSYYLAMLNYVNPTPIPFVDEFKERMSAS